jgi:DNA-binding MarR family transcriptional regulator
VDEAIASTVEFAPLGEPGPDGMLTRLARVGLLLDDFQHRCFDRFRLRFIDYSVLRVMHLAGPPYQMTPTKLSESVVRSTGGMTQILDRLEGHGLVKRTADRADRRRVLVGLTKKGLTLIERANAAYVDHKTDLLARLDDGELAQVDAAIQTLLDLLTEEHERAGDAGRYRTVKRPPSTTNVWPVT